MSTESYDGALISELGVRRYLKATKDIKLSNINFLIRGDDAHRAWQECSFGCHGPTYRSLRKPSTKAELFAPIEGISPALAGVADGIHHQTFGQVDRLAKGVVRTAEGLHIAGKDNFQQIGDENTAAFDFAKTTFEKLINFEVDLLDNPISQIVTAIVCEYSAALPEWLIEELVKQDALKFPEKIDTVWLFKASAFGIVDNIDKDEAIKAISMLSNPAQRVIGKQVGKRMASVISMVIATSVTKKLLATSPEIMRMKRDLVRLRRAAKSMKGGLGGALMTLLNSQGLLHKAAESSRRLQNSNPRLWHVVRFKLNGANMVYFLVESMVREYVDRLTLLEQNPREFGKVLEALIRDKKTQSIFFPASL